MRILAHAAIGGFGILSAGYATAMAADPGVMATLSRYADPAVAAMGPSEIEVPPLKPAAPAPTALPGRGIAQHPMLYVGEGYNKAFVVNRGRVVWTYSTGPGGEYDDAWILSNGNLLYTRQQYVAEVSPEKNVIWRYDAPPGTEIHTAQPIGLDKVLFVVNGLPPKLIVMNIRTGKAEVEQALPALSVTDPKHVHGQFRRARLTAKGTYLLSFLQLGRVVEYDRNFREIWRHEVPTPWAAVRLRNGNTLITSERDAATIEVNPKGETIWELKPSDLPERYRFANTQTATRLANGNTIICSRGVNGEGQQLTEVTRDKKVVWVLNDRQNLGPATAVQVLDEPGRPEEPGRLQR